MLLANDRTKNSAYDKAAPIILDVHCLESRPSKELRGKFQKLKAVHLVLIPVLHWQWSIQPTADMTKTMAHCNGGRISDANRSICQNEKKKSNHGTQLLRHSQ